MFKKAKIVTVAAFLSVMTTSAPAEDYPNQPIRLLVGFSAGGPTDQAARHIAESMTSSIGQPVIVENLPGANSGVAIRSMLNEEADGHTLLMGTTGFPIAEARYTNLEFAMAKDFSFVGTVAGYPHVLVVPIQSEHEDVTGFLDAAKSDSYPPIVGVSSHATELLVAYINWQAEVELEHIPYQGHSASVTDLLAGRLDAAVLSPAVAQPFIDAEQLRAIGVSSAERFSLMPDVPTFQEQGLEGFNSLIWNGLLVHADTDETIITKLNEALNYALNDETVVERLRLNGLEPQNSTPEEFRKDVLEELETWKSVMQEAGIERITQ